MKYRLYYLIFVIAALMVSCSNGIEPADPAIEYSSFVPNDYNRNEFKDIPLKGCFEVQKVSAVIVDGEEYSNIHSQINVTIELKMTKDLPGEVYDNNAIFLLMNEDGAKLANGFLLGSLEGKSAGDIITFTGHTDEDSNSTVKDMYEQIRYIRIVDFYAKQKINGKGASDNYAEPIEGDTVVLEEMSELEEQMEIKAQTSNPRNISSDGVEYVDDEDPPYVDPRKQKNNPEYEKLLVSYEKYVNNYIAYTKKIKDGDVSAISNYTKLLQQAQEISSKIEKVKGDLSIDQLSRFNDLSIKLANALGQ